MTTTTGIIKEPFKVIEIPVNKFYEEAIPHHLSILEQHKNAVQKFMSIKNTQQLSREVTEKKRVVRQLKDLLYELDTLRARVEDVDLDRFDSKTFSLRRTLSTAIKDYGALQKSALQFIESQNEINENIENENPFLGADQIQVKDDIEKLKLQQSEERLKSVEALNSDIQDLHGIYNELNTMVHDQKESVNTIENNVENTAENVSNGLTHLIKAYQIKNTAYPVTGAFIGSLIGGPLGLVVGFKTGGLAALGCGMAGYTGGKLFKKYNDKHISNDCDNVENDVTTERNDKKDI